MDLEVPSYIKYDEEFYTNSREVKFLTCKWIPKHRPIRGVVCLCHGYAMDVSRFMIGTGVYLGEAGYAVHGIEYEGHGRSDGLQCYISDFTRLIDDTRTYYKTIRELEEYKNIPKYILGESMGGCVALSIHLKEPTLWDGGVFAVPMCKISEKTRMPPDFLMTALDWVTPFIGTWKIVPANDVIDTAFKEPEKRLQVRANPYAYQDRPRLKTVLEAIKASKRLQKNLDKVSLPFFVLHGEDDIITDPDTSRALYNAACSTDKTFKLYPDTWHGIFVGETDDKIRNVFNDIIAWLDKRSPEPISTATAN